MSDRQLRKILADVIAQLDSGRLRPLRPPGLRNAVGTTVLAAALGLGAMACDGRSVGSATDAGALPDVVQMDAAGQVDAGQQVDSGAVGAYGIPEVDAGTVVMLDGGVVDLYMAMGFEDGGVEAWDAEVEPAEDAEVEAPAYMAPFPEPEDD